MLNFKIAKLKINFLIINLTVFQLIKLIVVKGETCFLLKVFDWLF
jgi:hypothetical protein